MADQRPKALTQIIANIALVFTINFALLAHASPITSKVHESSFNRISIKNFGPEYVITLQDRHDALSATGTQLK